MTELRDRLFDRVTTLSAAGNELARGGDYDGALARYWEAFDLLPDPKTDWEAGAWLLAAIGDANFLQHDYVAGRDNLASAMSFPGAVGNPFLHFRLGQCQFELGNLDRAADELMRAYMSGGPDIFARDDEKYLRFLATRAKDVAPPGKQPIIPGSSG